MWTMPGLYKNPNMLQDVHENIAESEADDRLAAVNEAMATRQYLLQR